MSHTLTLSFPTLAELAAAVQLLTGTPLSSAPVVGNDKPVTTSSRKPSVSVEKTAEPEKVEAPAEEKKPKPVVEQKPVEPFEYKVLQKAVMDLVAVDPEGPKTVLKEFSIPTFKGSDPSIWAAAKASLEKATAEAKAAKAAADAA